MSTTPDLVFRRLQEVETEMAAALAASAYEPDNPQNESFGLTPEGPPASGGEVWGLFIRDTLAAALWVLPPAGSTVEVAAAAIPRKRRHMGLLMWMAGEVARATSLAGGRELLIRVSAGGPGLGESLSDAAFTGPDPESEDYPKGEWRRPAFGVQQTPSAN